MRPATSVGLAVRIAGRSATMTLPASSAASSFGRRTPRSVTESGADMTEVWRIATRRRWRDADRLRRLRHVLNISAVRGVDHALADL